MVIEMVKDVKVNEFIKEYETLCKKYNVVIESCGCCDGAYAICLDDAQDKENRLNEAVQHIKDVS